MKFSINLKLLGLFLILATIVLTRISRKIKSKVKTKNPLCPKLKGSPEISINTLEDVFPADTQGVDAKKNAEVQTKAARNLFYNPKEKVIQVLKHVAQGYTKLININKNGSLFTDINKIQRQTSEAGTWQVYSQVLTELNLTEKDFADDVVERIMTGTDVLPRDYLGFLGLLGDIGACLQDVINRNLDINNPGDKPKFGIKDALISFFGDDLLNKSKAFYTKYSPDSYYDIKTDPGKRSKKGDRKTCTASGKRSGVMDVGTIVDETIKVNNVIVSNLNKESQLPRVSWPWQTVKKSLIDFCPKEPWAGHFSGSLYELILMLEIFDRESPKTDTEPSSDKKKTYSAIASAFLIATGMHSAVEVVYVDKLYTGAASLTPDKILSNEEVCKDATYFVSSLITEQNVESTR